MPEETLEELGHTGTRAFPVPGDLSDEESVRRMVEAVVGELGRVDALVNNAGISAIVPAEKTTLAEWRRVLEVNLTGPFLMSREFGKEIDQCRTDFINLARKELGLGSKPSLTSPETEESPGPTSKDP
jgi:NAD(P)-dependent dehydrogenase (short-subunit alcohol dehydrogenase family)